MPSLCLWAPFCTQILREGPANSRIRKGSHPCLPCRGRWGWGLWVMLKQPEMVKGGPLWEGGRGHACRMPQPTTVPHGWCAETLHCVLFPCLPMCLYAWEGWRLPCP